jgi:B12-binding domain/radical SAM domain protein
MSSPDLILIHAPSVYDFRRESILYGPISDLVPSTPVFEMYPIGFTTIAEYLERHGFKVRIVNLALRMLQDHAFDAEAYLAKLDAAAFGIDLHWMPHAHGALEVAKAVKHLHPRRPIIFGGFSSTYFHQELIERAEVDYVVRGDSTEAPMLDLMRYICSGGRSQPQPGSADERRVTTIPNLVWKDADNLTRINPLGNCPTNLDGLLLDYGYVLKAVMRYRDLANFLPFRTFIRYPITAALSVRGCRYNCVSCGGSASAYRRLHGRQRPAYRRPEDLANDIRRVGRFSRGPVFVLGDIRQAGMDYAHRFLEAISGFKKPILLELFDAAGPEFFERVRQALPNFTVEVSLESHDDGVRKAFGRPYTTQAIEQTMSAALDAGCQRLDVFFMVGLPQQTYASVMGTIDYCHDLLNRFSSNGDRRLAPFISPLAPFLDPGSQAFEDPARHGYRLYCRTLEEHRQALLMPSWKHALNYETKWMDRDTIVRSTYEAGRRLNQLKLEHGLIEPDVAEATDTRIERAVRLSDKIDFIMSTTNPIERQAQLHDLKAEVSTANLSTVCDKRELELPLRGKIFQWLPAAQVAFHEYLKDGKDRARKSVRQVP